MTRCFEVLSLVALVAMVVGSVSAAPLYTDDLVFYYGFDSVNGDGTTVADGSGNGFDGTISGNVTQTTSPYGNAALFWHDGVDVPDQPKIPGVDPTWNFVTLPTDSMPVALLPDDAMTVACWYNTRADYENQSFFNVWSSNNKWTITCILGQHDDLNPAADNYRFTLRDCSGNNVAECTVGWDGVNGPIWDEWTHIAMTYSRASGKIYVYQNGEQTGVANKLSENDICTDWGDEDEMTDGSARVSTEGDNCRQFRGALDEVYVFSRALSPEEIANLAAPRIPGDANDDRVVDNKDASILGANWLTSSPLWENGDFNGDGYVNDKDAAILAANWSPGEASSVPEPSTLAMLLGAAVMAWLVRRRTR